VSVGTLRRARRRNGPQQTGCPGWLRHIEQHQPEYLPFARLIADTRDGYVDFTRAANILGIPEVDLFEQLDAMERERIVIVTGDGQIRRALPPRGTPFWNSTTTGETHDTQPGPTRPDLERRDG
jgi:hypothetical protein